MRASRTAADGQGVTPRPLPGPSCPSPRPCNVAEAHVRRRRPVTGEANQTLPLPDRLLPLERSHATKDGGKWEQSIARQIRRILDASDGGHTLENKDRLTAADLNHIRMNLSYLKWGR